MSSPQPLIDAPKRRGPVVAIIIGAGLLVIALIAALLVFNSSRGADTAPGAQGDGSGGIADAITEGPGSPAEPVRIGVVGASDPYWDDYVSTAADAGITVQLVDFSEYSQPNPALAEGDLDLNQFQHSVYLAQYNVQAAERLVPIGSTAIYPLGLYSTRYDSVDDIQDGDTVAVPNDPSNLARALLVLQSAGLVELADGGSIFGTLGDIDTAASRVQVIALDAALTPTSLPDVAAAIINNDFVADAGLAATDAIAQDDPTDPAAIPYINIFAAREDDADNEVFLRLVEIFQGSETVIDGLVENSGGTAIPVRTPVDELAATLLDVEEQTAAQR